MWLGRSTSSSAWYSSSWKNIFHFEPIPAVKSNHRRSMRMLWTLLNDLKISIYNHVCAYEYSPAPNVRPSIWSPHFFHVVGNHYIFPPMIAATPAGKPMDSNELFKKLEHSFCPIVVVSPDPSYKAWISIDKTMDNNFIPNQTYNERKW